MEIPIKTARDVTEYLLRRTEAAFHSGDFDEFKDSLTLPYHLETFKGRRTLNTTEKLRDLFDAVRAHHRRTGVTDMDRYVLEASFQDDKTIVATFETRLLNGTVLTQKPYPVLSVMKFDGGAWRAHSMTFAIDDNEDHNAALMGEGDRNT